VAAGRGGADLKSELVAVFVRSDPEPIIIAISFAGQCSVAAANLRRINAPFFLKANRGMVWVGLEESEFFVSEFLNALRQRVIALPKDGSTREVTATA
jgi:hypothetical protein